MLNGLWHSVLPVTVEGNLLRNRRKVFYGAEFENVWYAVAIWTDPVAANRFINGRRMLELRRYAIAPDAPKNTASRMLGVMRRLIAKQFPDVMRLVSYQATDHHAGTIYKAAGWQKSGETEFVSWDGRRKRNIAQTTSAKVRWEFPMSDAQNRDVDQRIPCPACGGGTKNWTPQSCTTCANTGWCPPRITGDAG